MRRDGYWRRLQRLRLRPAPDVQIGDHYGFEPREPEEPLVFKHVWRWHEGYPPDPRPWDPRELRYLIAPIENTP